MYWTWFAPPPLTLPPVTLVMKLTGSRRMPTATAFRSTDRDDPSFCGPDGATLGDDGAHEVIASHTSATNETEEGRIRAISTAPAWPRPPNDPTSYPLGDSHSTDATRGSIRRCGGFERERSPSDVRLR